MHVSRSRYRLFAVFCATTVLPAVWAQAPANFISIVPCRVVDTRNANGPLGGPSMSAGSTRSFPIPSGNCPIPANASAYSLNLAVVPRGALGYVTVWPTGQSQPTVATLNDRAGLILNNSALVEAGTSGSISVYVTAATDVILDFNGYFLAQSVSSTESTALGTGANDTGTQNTAVGYETLLVNSSGNGNTATGAIALASNTSGNNNVAVGSAALGLNTTGSANTAAGTDAMFNDLIGSDNIAIGFDALWSNTTGAYNTAVGVGALFNTATASNNIGIGYRAGTQLTFGTDNIEIGNGGTSSDSNVIRIGEAGVQVGAFIAGINNASVSGSAVLVDPTTGQLGIASSSGRYKDDVRDLGDASNALLQLRPVMFRYKRAAGDSSKPLQYGLIGEEVEKRDSEMGASAKAGLQYGLIGEEVEKVYPELVVHGRDGEVESVQYHELPALLLNELQKQHKRIEELEVEVGKLKAGRGRPARTRPPAPHRE